MKNDFIHGYFSKILIQFQEDLFDRAPCDSCSFTQISRVSPFDPDHHQLKVLGSGLIAEKTVNCNGAGCVGKTIQDSVGGVSLREANVK